MDVMGNLHPKCQTYLLFWNFMACELSRYKRCFNEIFSEIVDLERGLNCVDYSFEVKSS